MCVIDNSDIQFKKEFAELLNGCTADEYRLLYNLCKAALDSKR